VKEDRHQLRVVIDTNVLISFLFGGENMNRIVDALTAGKVQAVVTTATITELREVAARKKFTSRFSKLVADHFIGSYSDIALHVTPKNSVKISRDNKDNIFLDCAIESKADYLITGDKDLLVIGHYKGINIVTPAAFGRMVL